MAEESVVLEEDEDDPTAGKIEVTVFRCDNGEGQCNTQSICRNDIIGPYRGVDNQLQIFWDTLLRLEVQDGEEAGGIPVLSHWLFRSLPRQWITNFMMHPCKMPLHRQVLPWLEHSTMHDRSRVSEQYGHMNVLHVSLSKNFLADLPDDHGGLDEVSRGCILLELYSAPINVSLSKQLLESMAFTLCNGSSYIDNSVKREAIMRFLEGEGRMLLEVLQWATSTRCNAESVLCRLLLVRRGETSIPRKLRKLEILNRIKWHPCGTGRELSA